MRRRNGYTLIELLITMALIMLIMAILSTSFIVGLDTFGKLKALGDLSERLRAATTLLRRDLDADHFEGRIRVSDPALVSSSQFHRPREGFFAVRQFNASRNEGLGADGVRSYGYPTTQTRGHALHMAVKLRGNRPENFFSARVPAGSLLLQPGVTFFNQPVDARHQDPAGQRYMCQWAEVAYYVQPLPNSWTANGTPLYALYRQVKLAVVNNTGINNQNLSPLDQYPGYAWISARVGTKTIAGVQRQYLHFNSPRDWAETAPAANGKTVGQTNRAIQIENQAYLANVSIDNIVLTDVVSFSIKLLPAPPIPAPQGQQPAPYGYPLGVADFQDVPDYDTTKPPYPVLAIQITLRVWDLRSQQTRQITLIQDL